MTLILPAYAKLNLTLDVLGRRPNAYHDIDSVMQTVSLHDLISIESTDCRVFDLVGPSIEGENLVLKAARELEGHIGRALPFTIRLFKRIPIGAGLGGGSADAAAFLRAADRLYDLRLKPDDLVRIATEVGQDVPFFLHGGTARATGLGSTLAPLAPVPARWCFVVICPPVQVSTRAVYEAVDGRSPSARRTSLLVEALAREEGTQLVGNDLEAVSRRLFPALDEAIERLRTSIPSLTMTGSGAAMFAVFDNRPEAEAALTGVKPLGYPAWLCRPIPAS